MYDEKNMPRGIRNRNPGNIRHGDSWRGRCDEQTDPAFIQFKAPEWGIRAICRVLNTYQSKYDLRTTRELIGRWAPPNENDTESYVMSVAGKLGVDPDDPVDVTDFKTLETLLRAIIRHENGMDPYDAEVVNRGIEFSGILKAP